MPIEFGYDDAAHLAHASAFGGADGLAPNTTDPDCGLPVFMPGGDTPDTTAHLVDALSSNPAWSVLTWAEHPDSTTNRQWYRGDSRCAGSPGDGLSCDEYPFYTSRQGGPGASLRLVPGWEQDKQGGFLSAFYGACGIGQGDSFVVDPMPSLPTTTFRC
ncbi:MAG: NucA/NucB deoxyribonuclease domain-containing protein [Acidimicrobiales bacterium]